MRKPTKPTNFRKDSVIHVNRHSLIQTIKKAETYLGLNSEQHNPQITYMEETPQLYAFYQRDGKFSLVRKSWESSVFHESVHYLMDKAHLLFGPDHGIHGVMIDEFLAELATGEAYDMEPEIIVPIELIGENGAIEMARSVGRNDIDEIRMGIDAAQRHKILERDYLQIEHVKFAEKLVEFANYFAELPQQSKEDFYAISAADAAARALKMKLYAKKAVDFVKEGLSRGYPTTVIYFSITDNMRKSR